MIPMAEEEFVIGEASPNLDTNLEGDISPEQKDLMAIITELSETRRSFDVNHAVWVEGAQSFVDTQRGFLLARGHGNVETPDGYDQIWGYTLSDVMDNFSEQAQGLQENSDIPQNPWEDHAEVRKPLSLADVEVLKTQIKQELQLSSSYTIQDGDRLRAQLDTLCDEVANNHLRDAVVGNWWQSVYNDGEPGNSWGLAKSNHDRTRNDLVTYENLLATAQEKIVAVESTLEDSDDNVVVGATGGKPVSVQTESEPVIESTIVSSPVVVETPIDEAVPSASTLDGSMQPDLDTSASSVDPESPVEDTAVVPVVADDGVVEKASAGYDALPQYMREVLGPDGYTHLSELGEVNGLADIQNPLELRTFLAKVQQAQYNPSTKLGDSMIRQMMQRFNKAFATT